MLNSNMLSLTGIKPSGSIHLGNYFGAIKPFLNLQNKNKILLIADLHALTVNSFHKVKEWREAMLLDLVALGVDESNIIFQSDHKSIPTLSLILSKFMPLSQMNRGHSYKNNQSKGLEMNLLTFCYPALMAADILIFNAGQVLVGHDQKQHLEFARFSARRLQQHGVKVDLPNPIISDLTVLGTDGRKMSKSYGNCIDIFSEKIRDQIFSITTDSKGVHEPKDRDKCLLYKIYSLFGSVEEEIRSKYQFGGLSYSDMKDRLYNRISEYFQKTRKLRQEIKFSQIQSKFEKSRIRLGSLLDKNLNNIISALENSKI